MMPNQKTTGEVLQTFTRYTVHSLRAELSHPLGCEVGTEAISTV